MNSLCPLVALTILLCLVVGCAAPGQGPARADSGGVTRLFILAGQSNMVGAGRVEDLLDEQRRTPPNIRLFEGGRFRELVYEKTFGPEVGFADALVEAGVREQVVLVKLAVGGTHLYGEWHPDARPPRPGESPRDCLYPRLIAEVNQARVALAAEGRQVAVTGMLWMQGERDSRTREMADAYERNLARLIQAVRKDVGVADLPVVVGKVCPRMMVVDLGSCIRIHAYREKVRAAQAAVAAKDPRVELVETDDLPQFDNLHFDAAGQMALGRRFARAYLKMVGR